ncbi:MAG: hypothetical protein JO360_02770 [Acidobacteria bacterium]|nr:hypothetical protein [Acidobacteriota bacterium]
MSAPGKTRLKIWLVIVGVFALGCVTGASLDSVYRLRGRGGKADGFERMKRDLNLNEQQSTQIRAIVDQTRNDYRSLRTEVRPRYDAIRQSARTRIRALLDPEQQQRFDARMAERDARREDDNRDDH